jgi:hypothetical protein
VPAADEPFGWVPFVFFGRVRDRLRVERVDELPGRRAQELERVLRESPGALTAARESTVPTGRSTRRFCATARSCSSPTTFLA